MANQQKVKINGTTFVYVQKPVTSGVTATGEKDGTIFITSNPTGRGKFFVATSGLLITQDATVLPVKASGAEANTGTDDAKFLTAKALADADAAKAAATPASSDLFYFRTSAGVVKKITFANLAALINV